MNLRQFVFTALAFSNSGLTTTYHIINGQYDNGLPLAALSFICSMVGLEDSIKSLLRPSDEIKFVLECFSLSSSNDDTSQNGIKGHPNLQRQRIVVVITHKEEGHGWEEGR